MQSTAAEASDDGNNNHAITNPTRLLTDEQIATFLQDGVLVVDDLLSRAEVENAMQNGLARTLREQCSVDVNDLCGTASNLRQLSSTNGSGGVLDVFYDAWKMKIALNPTLFAWTRQLWKAAYCHDGQSLNDLNKDEQSKWHPYGKFDTMEGFAYIDRICYRLPTRLAEELGGDLESTKLEKDTTMQQQPNATKKQQHGEKKKKRAALQRGLTPHLDCCPDTYHDDPTNKSKWRPIQCFVSLTDNLDANTGGFEAATGFHRNFREWARNRPYTEIHKKKKKKRSSCGDGGSGRAASSNQNGNDAAEDEDETVISFPAPCMGEYTVSTRM
jgi:hypothetical protein